MMFADNSGVSKSRIKVLLDLVLYEDNERSLMCVLGTTL